MKGNFAMTSHYFTPWLAGMALACFVIYQVKKTMVEYPKVKEAIAKGDPHARWRFYLRILRFEWLSAALALIALGFDRTRFMAARLQMGNTAFGRWIATMKARESSAMIGGMAIGLVGGLVILTLVRLRSRRSALVQSSPKPWWRKLVPDIAALIPVTGRERLLFTAVAISAGICEEIVFRGWLLYVLHTPLGFTGTTLVLIGAALFGLCHLYQGPFGVLGAAAAGLILTALYIATGTLLAPIVLHALIDLRVAILPSSSPQVAQAQPA